MWLYLFIFRIQNMAMCTLFPLGNSQANDIYINLDIHINKFITLKELSSSAQANCWISQSCISWGIGNGVNWTLSVTQVIYIMRVQLRGLA